MQRQLRAISCMQSLDIGKKKKNTNKQTLKGVSIAKGLVWETPINPRSSNQNITQVPVPLPQFMENR